MKQFLYSLKPRHAESVRKDFDKRSLKDDKELRKKVKGCGSQACGRGEPQELLERMD